MIKISNLCKNFGEKQVLRGINVHIKAGDVIAIIGPSGGGKSTFLRSLNRLEEPSSGSIEIGGCDICAKSCDIDAMRADVCMVFQHFNLFANYDVLGNLTLAPVLLKKFSREEAEARASALLQKVGLAGYERVRPHKLSGGQKQRIAIARALMMNPSVLLFDEPTSALDPEMVGEVLALIKEIAASPNAPVMLLVTHEMGFARNVANRVFFIDGGQIEVDAPPAQAFSGQSGNARLDEFLNQVLNH